MNTEQLASSLETSTEIIAHIAMFAEENGGSIESMWQNPTDCLKAFIRENLPSGEYCWGCEAFVIA